MPTHVHAPDEPTADGPPLITLADIQAARGRIAHLVKLTPVDQSISLTKLAGVEVWLKLENFQCTGSFKARGAANKMSQLTPDERARGVVAFSAGNHAQGVAWAATALGIRSTVFMPESAPPVKAAATRAYGAEVVLSGETLADAGRAMEIYRAEHDAVLIHPFDDPLIIAGQGTLGLELVEQIADLGEGDTVVVPIGGGGLISGVATALKALRPGIRIVGVQAEGADAAYRTFRDGQIQYENAPSTIADGIAVKSPSELTWAHIRARVDDVVTVTDEQIGQAIVLLIERARVVAEGAGAAAVAAVVAGKVGSSRKVVPLVCGGNIDPPLIVQLLGKRLASEGRILRLTVEISDRPGGLAGLLSLLADLRANVLDVVHDRFGIGVGLGRTGVEISMETRGPEHDQLIIDRLHAAGYPERRSR